VSPRPWYVRIDDILDAMTNIRTFIDGLTEDTFVSDKKSIRAVAYEIAVIGEAVRHLPAEVKERYTTVPWPRLQAMRNVVIHEYFRIDVDLLWHTVVENLLPLEETLRAIRDAEDG